MSTTAGVLISAVGAVVGQDLQALSVPQLQQAVAVGGVQGQRLAGFSAQAAAVLQARVGDRLPTEDGGTRPVTGWVAEATSSSPSAAGRMMRLAGLLQGSLPGVAQAVLDGTVGFAQAEVLCRLVGQISGEALAGAEPHLIVTAQRMNPSDLAVYVRHLLATWVEPVVDDDEASAARRRYLKTRREQDGSLWGSFRLTAGDAETVLTTLEPLSRSSGAREERSAAQRRADALVEVCEQVLRHGDLPDSGGARPQLAYVLPADWAARQAEQDSCRHCVRCPQHGPRSFADLVAAGVPGADAADDLFRTESHTAADDLTGGVGAGAAGFGGGIPAEHGCAVAAWTGPQTRSRIEAMLCDARISRVLLDSLGQVSGLESLTDSVTPAQRRALAARDLGCAVRGCTRPPALCDAHHLVRRSDGGPTTLDNLVLLCRRHHVLWHLGKIHLQHLHVPWLDAPRARGPAPPVMTQPVF
jgi:hypothetical protein